MSWRYRGAGPGSGCFWEGQGCARQVYRVCVEAFASMVAHQLEPKSGWSYPEYTCVWCCISDRSINRLHYLSQNLNFYLILNKIEGCSPTLNKPTLWKQHCLQQPGSGLSQNEDMGHSCSVCMVQGPQTSMWVSVRSGAGLWRMGSCHWTLSCA